MTLRTGHWADLPFLYEICHRTGYGGADASDVVSDRWLLGSYFAAPYLLHDPSWCWVACDDQGLAGYLVTTPDSRAFADWMNAEWLPGLRTLYSSPVDCSDFETWLRTLIHEPATVPDFVDDYPAHLHIDFLPRAQGQGLGTRILALFLHRLRTEGVPGFHLGVADTNLRAQAFYAKQGFRVLTRNEGAIYLGLRF